MPSLKGKVAKDRQESRCRGTPRLNRVDLYGLREVRSAAQCSARCGGVRSKVGARRRRTHTVYSGVCGVVASMCPLGKQVEEDTGQTVGLGRDASERIQEMGSTLPQEDLPGRRQVTPFPHRRHAPMGRG